MAANIFTVLANAQAAVTAKLRTRAKGMVFAGLVPAAVIALLYVWTVEAYWAAIGFRSGSLAVVASSLVVAFVLSSLAIGRMVRIALDLDPQPDFPRGFAFSGVDLRAGAASLLLAFLAVATVFAWAGIQALVEAAFIAPGSGAIAAPVDAALRAGVLLGTFYVGGRLSILIPALASEDGISSEAAWNATDGHGSLLFIVCLAVPVAVGSAFIAPVLVVHGALPWPGPDDFSRIEAMVARTREGLPLVLPLLFMGVLAAWMLAGAGLACAWAALKEAGRTRGPAAA